MELISFAKNPVPSGAFVSSFQGYNAVALRCARWEATRGPLRGTVCVFQGRAECIEKYYETIADLRRRGFAVATFDWRGQGQSDRILRDHFKGHVSDFSDYERDLVIFMKDIVLPNCPPPYYALAHSMGGNILLKHATRPVAEWFERLVLTTPMLAFNDGRIGYPQSFVKSYAKAGCYMGFGGAYVFGGTDDPFELNKTFEGNILTSDQNRWERNTAILSTSPRLGIGSPTVAWLNAAYNSCAAIDHPNFASSVRVPTLMFAAGEDKLVSTSHIEEFGVRLKVGNHVLIPDARHEILQEKETVRQRFWATFDAYISSASQAA